MLAIQRFKVEAAYPFKSAKRAGVPPSVDMMDMGVGKNERHHVVGDRSILNWIGDKEAGAEVPVNKWAAAALTSEVTRATAAIEAAEQSDRGDEPKVVRNKFAIDKAYKPLQAKFGDGPADEATPVLDKDNVDYLMTVLEWTPNNFIIDKEVRRLDPGDDLDIEALLLKDNVEMRILLFKIAVAMGEVEEPTLAKLDAAFRKNEERSQVGRTQGCATWTRQGRCLGSVCPADPDGARSGARQDATVEDRQEAEAERAAMGGPPH